MQKKYSLYGFSSAGAQGPHFIEPVFSDGERLFVQVASKEDIVIKFKEFEDAVDFYELKENEKSSVGEPCMFGIVDKGGRLIYGQKDYVSRYISQNVRRYIDNPYFLKECSFFTGETIPEVNLFKSSREMLELSVAVNSIKEFAESDSYVREWVMLTCGNGKYINNDYKSLKGNFGNGKTVFGAWLSFARERGHRVAESSRWSKIEDNFLKIYDNDVYLANKNFKSHFYSCLSAVSKEGNSENHQFEEINNNVRNKYSDNFNYHVARQNTDTAFVFVNKPLEIDWRILSAFEDNESINNVIVSHNKDNARKIDTAIINKWVKKAMKIKLIEGVELAVHLYFMSIIISISIGERDD